jgi:hypothetical protein
MKLKETKHTVGGSVLFWLLLLQKKERRVSILKNTNNNWGID